MIFDHEIGKYFRFLCDLILCWLSQILIIVGNFFYLEVEFFSLEGADLTKWHREHFIIYKYHKIS